MPKALSHSIASLVVTWRLYNAEFVFLKPFCCGLAPVFRVIVLLHCQTSTEFQLDSRRSHIILKFFLYTWGHIIPSVIASWPVPGVAKQAQIMMFFSFVVSFS